MKKNYLYFNFTMTTTKFMAYLIIPYSLLCMLIVKDVMIPVTAMGTITILLGANKYAEVKLNKKQEDEQPIN